MFDLVIGAGQGGGRLAKEISDLFKITGIYINFADVDYANFDVPVRNQLVVCKEGTGRNAAVGEQLMSLYSQRITNFLDNALCDTKANTVCLCVGGGGGSGTGMMLSIIDFILSYGAGTIKLLLLYTIPRKLEGLPAKPQAFQYLNKIISVTNKNAKRLSVMLIDNDFCVDRYKVEGKDTEFAYWVHVNKGIARTLKMFYDLTQLDKYLHIDTASGLGAVDLNELIRIMWFGDGFLDIREFDIDYPDTDMIRSALKDSERIFKGLDKSTCKAYIASIALPDRWKGHDVTNMFVDSVFDVLKRDIKTPYVMRSSFYSNNLSKAKILILLAGITGGAGLEKHIKQIGGDTEKFEARRKNHLKVFKF